MQKLNEKTWNELHAAVTDVLSRGGLELWDLEFKQERGGTVLRVYIDKEGKVTIDDCAAASERIGMMLDVEDLIPQAYTLEVSSPGMDRKLVKEAHFQRYIDRLISVKLHNEVVGRKKFQGRLRSVDESTVIIYDENEKQEHSISRGDIREARLVIEFKP